MNNSSVDQSNEVSPLLGPWFLYPVATGYILIAAVAVIGNLLVCFAILANKSLRNKPTNLFSTVPGCLWFSNLSYSNAVRHRVVTSSRRLETWCGSVPCVSYRLPHHCTHLDFDASDHQRGSLPKPSWSSTPLSPHTVHDKKESFNSDRSHMAVLHHFCFSSRLRMAVYKKEYEKRTRTMLNFLQCVVQHLEQFFELCFAIGNYLCV